jgi:glutathione synthase
MTPNIVTSSMDDIEKFLKQHKQIVLKPMNRCFGSGVMYLYDGDPNTHTIINTLTNNETTLVMVQEYIPEVKSGDIRVLTLGDKILPYSIKKLPGGDDFKFNTHSDNFIVKSELTGNDLEYFTPIAQKLNEMGIEMAGLDVIGKNIIEVNVTSPCYFIKEINNAFGIELEKELVNYLLTPSLLSL